MDGPPPRSQNEVARLMTVGESALSRWLTTGKASYALVLRAAEAIGVPVADLWEGKVPSQYVSTGGPGRHTWKPNDPRTSARDVAHAPRNVSRGTQDADPEAALRALEQMGFAVADMARQAIRQLELGPERPVPTPSATPPDAETVGTRARQAVTDAEAAARTSVSGPTRRRKGGL